jgi:hypothetical protein
VIRAQKRKKERKEKNEGKKERMKANTVSKAMYFI